MPEYREVIVGQSGQAITKLIAARIRGQRVVVDEREIKDPERPALREAEKLVATSGTMPVREGDPAGEILQGPLLYPPTLFDSVYDRDNAKLVLERALRSKQPVHVLLVGDAASGKSQLLECCAALPQTRYAVGGMTTSSGLVDFLLERPGTQLILIDEFGKADMSDYAALYSLMEQGQVPRLQHGKTEVVHWRGRIFGATNEPDLERIPAALRSRFVIVRLENYTAEQVATITERKLTGEGMSAPRAKAIAQLTSTRSRDPRDGIQIGRLAGEDGELGPIADQVVPRAKAGEIV